MVTNDCNLRCKYCYVNKERQYMPFPIAQKAVDITHEKLMNLHKEFPTLDFIQQKTGYIYFFGGEPLLNYPVIKQTVEYAEKTYPNDFHYGLVTNGMLLTKEMCEFFQKYKVNIKISYDGDFSTERVDKYNKNSAPIVKERIKMLLDYQPGALVRGTITAANIDHWFDTFLEYEKLGFQRCSFDFEYFTNWEQDDLISKIYAELEKFKKYYLYKFYSNEYPILHFDTFDYCISGIIKKELANILGFDNYNKNPLGICNHCGFGLEALCVDYKGDIFPCHESPTVDPQLCLGNVSTKIDYHKLERLQAQLCNLEDKFIKSRKCDNEDCLIFKNSMDCEYLSCPVQVIRTQKVTKLHCLIKNYCLNIIQEISQQLFDDKIILYDNYIKECPFYVILEDIMQQKDPKTRQAFIQEYKKLLIDVFPYM